LLTEVPLELVVLLVLVRVVAVLGLGLATRVEGALSVRCTGVAGDDAFSVFGEVRTDEGRYRAWGLALNIETGIVRFNGPYLNPSLNLLAIRPEIEVRAGVRVTGTLSAPVVQLYSDPSLPESEILSWVVLGRPTIISGAEGSSMQQAALGLLAGQLASSLADDIGVDELGVDESAVSIGKRISNELYVTYEAGLSGAASVLYVFYDITRRLTVRGQTGEATAVDLIYTINYD
jgi:translocation and assembly module TamB